jgi:hypothetical protein
MTRAGLVFCVALVAGGCATDPCEGKTGVCIAIHASGSAPTMDELRVNILTDDSRKLHGDSGLGQGNISLPVQFALRLPTVSGGNLLISLEGLRGGAIVARGFGGVTLPPSGHASVDVEVRDLGSIINATPGMLDFGDVPLGGMVSRAIAVSNPGPPAHIDAINVAGARYMLGTGSSCQVGGSIATGSSCTVSIKLDGTVPGNPTGEVTILAGGAILIVAVKAHVTGWVSESLTAGALPNLFSVWGTSATDVWASGGAGRLVHRGSDGTWSDVTGNGMPPTTVTLVGVYTPEAGIVWVVASQSGAYQSTDNGANWTFRDVSAIAADPIIRVRGYDKDHVFIGGTMGSILVADNNGSFVGDRAGTGPAVVTLLAAGAGSDMYAISNNNVWLRMGASDWRSVLDANAAGNGLLTGWAVSLGEFYAVGSVNNTSCMTALNCATEWHVTPTASTMRNLNGSQLIGAWASSRTDVYVVTNTGSVYHSVGDDVWNAVALPISITPLAIWGAGNDVFIVGNSGTILHRY